MEKISFYLAKGLRILLQRPAIRKSSIDKHSRVCSGSQLSRVEMDRYSYIGHDCFLNNVKIGSFCSIADYCRIGGASHQIEYVSTSPVFVSGKNVMDTNFSNHADTKSKQTIIENDVWIGMGCHIKEGVQIHTGSVIGMGSVVTNDIPPYEIWGGVPAKLIRKRFPDDKIEKLIEIHWWDWDKEKLRFYAQSFNDVDRFLNDANGNNGKDG